MSVFLGASEIIVSIQSWPSGDVVPEQYFLDHTALSMMWISQRPPFVPKHFITPISWEWVDPRALKSEKQAHLEEDMNSRSAIESFGNNPTAAATK